MSTTRIRHGAHRGRSGLLGALVPSLLAVAAVSALVTSLAVWQSEEGPSAPSASASTTSATRQAVAQPSTPAPATTPAPSVSATREQRTSPTGQPEVPAQEPTYDTEVVVLNQTTRAGLAGSVAQTLQTQGWQVPAVGNFRGVVPATTVYYPVGAEAAAAAVAADLPTEPRLRPRFGNLSTSRLTVVVTSSYPG